MTDLELLARIIQCEAGGEGEQGMKAVACVVMNRVNVSYGEYGRLEPTIRAVIYQPGQFDCARETIRGQYNAQNIYNMSVEDGIVFANGINGMEAVWVLKDGSLRYTDGFERYLVK